MKFFYFITVNILIIPQKPLIYKASLQKMSSYLTERKTVKF